MAGPFNRRSITDIPIVIKPGSQAAHGDSVQMNETDNGVVQRRVQRAQVLCQDNVDSVGSLATFPSGQNGLQRRAVVMVTSGGQQGHPLCCDLEAELVERRRVSFKLCNALNQ